MSSSYYRPPDESAESSSSGHGRRGSENDQGEGSSNQSVYADSGYGSVHQDLEMNPDAMAFSGQLHRRSPSMIAKKQAAAQIQQLHYNENRIALGRSIAAVMKLLKELQGVNRTWPIYYPTNNSSENGSNQETQEEDSPKDEFEDLADHIKGKEKMEEPLPPQTHEPRLVTPQVDREFNIFKLDLKMGGVDSHKLVHSLEKTSVASLLEGKIIQTMKHLASLRDRIDDITSKVLITGDLNSGKSTFCNALLRRKLLPVDQQPLTNVFCEVRDVRENEGIEKVHAVKIGRRYLRSDPNTYEEHDLKDLEDLVLEVEKYSILKVYVKDTRPVEQSLLSNGVVDISIIDAPGLNKDSYQTTQVFSRQEEIDLVVFVVSAENHFTLSAKEFITSAAHEKSFIFIVVNRFDQIKDKSRCMRRIMDQVADLAPETHKDARDFVHFVSSDGVVDSLPDLNSSSGPGDGGDPDDPGDDDGDNGNGFDMDEHPDFGRLENSLRNFVLEKRSISKLAPAKTYLSNILRDLDTLADVNIEVCAQESDRLSTNIQQLAPSLDKSVTEGTKVSEKLEHLIEETADGLYNYTTEKLTAVLARRDIEPKIAYTSILDAYNYAMAVKESIVYRIQESVYACEEHAKHNTIKSIDAIKSMGIMHLGDQSAFHKVFREDAMFSRKRDQLARSLKTEIEISDFFDIVLPQWVPLSLSKDGKEQEWQIVSSINNAITLASVVGGGQLIRNSQMVRHAINAIGFLDYRTFRNLVLPAIAIAGACGVVYVVSDIPNAVKKNLARKIDSEVQGMGYVHANALRISKESRKILKYPAQDVRSAFQTAIEEKTRKMEDYTKQAKKADESGRYFEKLKRESSEHRNVVTNIHLEIPSDIEE